MKKHILFLLLLSVTIQAMGQTITGKLTDESNRPIDFANVVLQNKQDSLFITGCVTDEGGRFTLLIGEKKIEDVILCISCIGYDNKIVSPEKSDVGTIILNTKAEQLQEVVVSARRSPYTMKGTSLVADVSKSLLKDAGNAMDVLQHIPYVNVSDKAISVFGKGAPIVYINNRKVRDNSEIEQLNSAQIKNVEVITTPGSQYDASVGAVIRITTLKSTDVGFAASFMGRVEKRTEWNERANLNLTYYMGKLTLFGNLSAGNYHRVQEQVLTTQIHSLQEYQIKQATDLDVIDKSYSAGLGMDYSFSNKHQIGGKYNYSWKGNSNAKINSLLDFQENKQATENMATNGLYDPTGHSGYLNTYYTGELGKIKVNLNVDYSYGESSTLAHYENISQGIVTDKINSNSENDYKLFAGKLDLSYPIGRGVGTVGGEYANTDNNSFYANNDKELQDDLPKTLTNSRQNLMALYANYQIKLGEFSLDAGIRYEHLDFDYRLNEVLQEGQSQTFDNVFPVISLAYGIPERAVNMSLSYRRTISRPSYYELRGDIQYNSPYSYEGGNPALASAFINNLSYLFSWKNFNLMADYQNAKNQSASIAKQFEDKPITLSTVINVDKYERINVSASWSPTFFKIWTPALEAGYAKQFLSWNYEGNSISYNKPGWYGSLYNTLKLPKDFALILYGEYHSAVDEGFIYFNPYSQVNASVQKNLFKNKLTLRLGVSDIFKDRKERWDSNFENVNVNKWNSGDNRMVYLIVSYNFNKLKKYLGKGAAESERNRLVGY